MAAPFGRDLLDTGLKLERGGERVPFDIPDHLARDGDLLACRASTAADKMQ